MSALKGRPWKPGQSGNPAGRTKGSGAVAKLRASIGEQVPEILKRLETQALGGDVQAARLLLERTIAPLKPIETATPLALPDGPAADQGAAVIRAIAAGDLAPGQGAVLLQAIASLARVVELAELEKRIASLEGKKP